MVCRYKYSIFSRLVADEVNETFDISRRIGGTCEGLLSSLYPTSCLSNQMINEMS